MPLIHLKKSLLLIFALACCSSCDSTDNGNRVSLGVSASLYELGSLQYQEEFAVQVSTPDGAPSANSIVTIKLTPISYNKGAYKAIDSEPQDGTVDSWSPEVLVVCNSEDTNGNGALDAGEDINGNLVLDPDVPTLTTHPDKTPTITSGSNVLVTDDNGFGYFAITYPKSEGAWSSVRVTAEASDGLPGNVATYELDLGVLVTDLEDLTIAPPSGGPSPYGTAADCTDPN